jgi:mannose-6-phosphate isomerase-like protein (cupin superfamily)
MRVLKKQTAPRYVQEEGIVSYLLVSPRTSDAKHLTTSVVEIKPGGSQRVHSHVPEQIYYILEGKGLMTVGDQKEHVGPGDCIFIPTETPHGLDNHGEVLLRYFSAAAPSFSRKKLENLWPLKSEAEKSREGEGV